MDIFLQITLGLLPALVTFVLLAIFRRSGRVTSIVLGSVFTLSAVTSLMLFFFYEPEREVNVEEESALLSFACAMGSREDGLSYATELLQDMRAEMPESEELVLCEGYLCAMKGDALGAKLLIQKAVENGAEEGNAAIALCDAALSEGKLDRTAAEFLGQTVEGGDKDALKNLKKHAKEALESRILSDSYDKAAEAVIQSEGVFKKFVSEGEKDSDKLKSCLSRLKSAAETEPGLAYVPTFRECRLKMNVLNGSFSQGAKLLDENAGYEEFAIISELYAQGLVKEGSFSEDFGKNYRAHAEQVAARLKELKEKGVLTSETLGEKPDATLERLDSVSSSPALQRVKNGLAEEAEDADSPNRAKANLQLAKWEYSDGKDDKASLHISAALSQVGVSDDDSFMVPMAGLADAIQDKDDPEKLKKVADLVDAATRHSSDEAVVLMAQKAKEEQKEQNSEQNKDEEKEEKQSFEDYMTDAVNKVRIALKITDVDASNFEEVKLTFNVGKDYAGTPEELKKLLKLTDCGVEITDFTVEKVDITATNILLCCDVSGSMGGKPIQDLKKAVLTYLDTMEAGENVALVTFSNWVETNLGFDTAVTDVRAAAERIGASGGTNMYGAIVESLKSFSSDPTEVHYILLLSDGQDGSRRDEAQIENEIGSVARSRGIVLFSLGLGSSVDSEYMTALADSTGGTYLAVQDSSSLESFYDELRNQARYRYTVTYRAKDTLRVSREVTLSHKDYEGTVSDTVPYYLGGNTDVPDPDETDTKIVMTEKTLYGISPRRIGKSNEPTVVTLAVDGFTAEDKVSVELDGLLDYSADQIKVEFVNDTTLRLTLPKNLVCCNYNVTVHVNDRTGIMTNALSVVDPSQLRSTEFGPYKFTSGTKVENGNTVTLSGDVTLNGWLHFDGDVVLEGNLNAYEITMRDNHGAYVEYDTATATGFAKLLASRCQVARIGALGGVILYNDTLNDPDSDDYKVHPIISPLLLLPTLMEMDSPGLKLYPNKLILETDTFSTDLPLQDVLLKSAKEQKLFDFKGDFKGVITGQSAGIDTEITVKFGKDRGPGPLKFGNFLINLWEEDRNSLKFRINTSDVSFGFTFEVELPFLFKGTGVMLEMDWKQLKDAQGVDKLWLNSAGFGVDASVNTSIGPVPVTVDDFKLKVSDITPDKNFFLSVFQGSCDFGISKISDYIKGLDEKVGDVSLLKLDDITLSFSFGQKFVSLETTVKFIEAIEFGKASFKAGYLPFNVMLLGIEEEANGLQASITRALKWETDNVHVNIGGQGNLNAHSKLFAIERVAFAEIDVGWWIFHKKFHADGRVLLGVYEDSEDLLNFAVIARGTGNKNVEEYYLTWNEKTKLDCGKRKL